MSISTNRWVVIWALANLVCLASPSFGQQHSVREYETAVAKGGFSLETGDFTSAVAFFTQALAVRPGDKTATTGLGIAYSRAGNFPKAKETLLKALAADPSDDRVNYELGIVMHKLGEIEEAKDFFTAVIEGNADGELKKAARTYLGSLAGKGPGEKKGLSFSLMGGLQYDSNVILESNNPGASEAQRKADWRAIVTAGANYRFLKSEKTVADGGYEFYQSSHHTLHDFNIQQHNLKLAATHDLSSTAKVGVRYTFGYTFAGGSHFSSTNETIPFLTKSFAPNSLTEFHYVCLKARYYNNDTLFPLNAQQSGTDRTGGLVHTVRVGTGSSVSIAYDYDANEANERFWSYQGNKGLLGFQSSLGKYALSLSVSYYDQQYRDVFAGYTAKRHDGSQEYSAGLTRDLAKNLTLSLSDLYTVHNSNLPVYEYTRNIVGLFVVTRL